MLSYQAWQGEYAADPSIVGSTIFIQAKPFTVIGVAPPGFFGDRVIRDVRRISGCRFKPSRMFAETAPFCIKPSRTGFIRWAGYGRAPTSARCRPSFPRLLRQWLYSRPLLTANGGAALIPKQHVVLTPAGGGIQTLQIETGKGLKMLMILSSVVLLIACANIANLMLARATSRGAGDCAAHGSGRGARRVMRQILTESVLLRCMGGLAGLGVAYAGSRTILALAFPDARYMPIDASPSLPVLGFAFLVSLLTGILFGAGPAWLASHAQPAEALRGVEPRRRATALRCRKKRWSCFRRQLSVVLLAGAILMTKSLVKLEHQDFGVTTANRYVLHFDPAGAGYTVDRVPALYRQMEDRFIALPGVASVSLAMYSPLEGDNWGECVIQQGHPAPGPNDNCGSTWDRVSTHFLDSIGVPIVRGRDFTEQDTATSPQVALVNQAFVKRFFPNQDPIGQHFGIDLPKYSGSFEIVGVFRDFKMNNPREPVRPVFLRPLTQRFTGYKEPEMISRRRNRCT